MRTINERALWGYEPDSVKNLVAERDRQHQAACEELGGKLERLRQEKLELQRRLEALREQLQTPIDDGELARQLLEEHYAATGKVLEARKKHRETMERQKEIERWISERQELLLTKVKTELNRLLRHEEQRGGERDGRLEKTSETAVVRLASGEDGGIPS